MMKKLTEKEAIELLKKYAPNEEVFRIVFEHSKVVQRIALRIASKCKGVDIYKVRIGSLLHDIGRFGYPPGERGIRHGLYGGDILRKEGLLDLAKIAERHIGTGLRKEDIVEQGLDLPNRDFVPMSKEEKIICHADNLVDHDKERDIQWCIDRYRRELGEKYAIRIKKLADEVEAMTA